jgi:hypothetical protein
MAKYILNSGGLKTHPEKAKKYFKELVAGLGNKPKILWCFFATLPDDCNDRFAKYTEMYKDYFPENVKPIHINADIESFEEQVKNADAIYFHGGKIKPLQDILEKYDLEKLFKGKNIGTNSASSMVLCKYAWSCDERKVFKCLNLFPIKFIAHYDSSYGSEDKRGPINWNKAIDDIKNFSDAELPIYALKEAEFIIFTI